MPFVLYFANLSCVNKGDKLGMEFWSWTKEETSLMCFFLLSPNSPSQALCTLLVVADPPFRSMVIPDYIMKTSDL